MREYSLCILAYSGLYTPVSATERIINPYALAYPQHTGPYSQSCKTHTLPVVKGDEGCSPEVCNTGVQFYNRGAYIALRTYFLLT